jgi:hypothetical protein
MAIHTARSLSQNLTSGGRSIWHLTAARRRTSGPARMRDSQITAFAQIGTQCSRTVTRTDARTVTRTDARTLFGRRSEARRGAKYRH